MGAWLRTFETMAAGGGKEIRLQFEATGELDGSSQIWGGRDDPAYNQENVGAFIGKRDASQTHQKVRMNWPGLL